MKLNNPFSEDTRNIFLYQYSCMNCGRSDRGLELHHITGRNSNSPLNAIALCLDCHKICGHSFKEESKYLQIEIRFLLRNQYELTKKDLEFYKEKEKCYNYINEH